MTFMEGREIRASGTREEEHQPKRTIMAKRTKPKADRDSGWGCACRRQQSRRTGNQLLCLFPIQCRFGATLSGVSNLGRSGLVLATIQLGKHNPHACTRKQYPSETFECAPQVPFGKPCVRKRS